MRLLAILLLGLAFGCVTSPTGRKQLMVVSDSQMNSMGVQAFAQIKAEIPIDRDPRANQYVRCIVDPIILQLPDRPRVSDWEVVVFRDDTPNAFAVPGKKIGVHTGMFKVAKTDAQMAAVLGHEVGHVLARHSGERASQNTLGDATLVVGALALGTDNPKAGVALGVLGLGVRFGVLMPYERTHENEADQIGLDLMAKAGFDPRQSVQLWKNMSEAGGAKMPEFLSTHPADQTRMKNLEGKMQPALSEYQRAQAAGRRPSCHL